MIDKKTLRVMVLDDDPFMIKLLRRMLADQGFTQIEACDSGRAALASVARADSRPDLVLCDLNMPEMDGIEFVRELVALEYTGSLILVSGVDERVLQTAERLVLAHRITMLGHLTKPFSPAQLAALVERWMPPRAPEQRPARKSYAADEVRAAIEAGQLVNHYQPKISVASGEVVGMETLVRWAHPQDGLVMPDQFVGTAEEHGLIDSLTHQVLAAALAQARSWRDSGLALRVAVNVSMDNLSSLAFPELVVGLATQAGIAPSGVTLEVTESRVMTDHRGPLEVLTRLRLKGFHLSIDDFGTGHSSMIQLRDMPFEQLKIDRGFVHRACSDRTLRAMYDTSLGLARQLGMEVVAEGVEDRSDWDLLRATQCDLAQGYFVAKPMAAERLPGWIAAWRRRVADEGLCAPSPDVAATAAARGDGSTA